MARSVVICRASAVIPVQESHLCSFVAFLAREGVKHRSIKTHLSAVHHLQIRAGLGDPFGASVQLPQLKYVIRGIKWVKGRECLLITPHILTQLWEVLAPQGHTQDTKLIWVAATLCSFAFLRARETTTMTRTSYDLKEHLCYRDVAFDNPSTTYITEITLKQSKTDPFQKGVKLAVGRTATKLSPVAAMVGFMAVRGFSAGPLFTKGPSCHENGL